LPDDLINKDYLVHLETAIQRGIKSSKNPSNYSAIVKEIENYLSETKTKQIT
jgi:hypothetical protein